MKSQHPLISMAVAVAALVFCISCSNQNSGNQNPGELFPDEQTPDEQTPDEQAPIVWEHCPDEQGATEQASSAELFFVAQSFAGGHVYPGSNVLYENGTRFLIIDEQFHFWVQTEPFGDVRTGTLSADEAQMLREKLRLDQWSEYVGIYSYPSSCVGGASVWKFQCRTKVVDMSSCTASNPAEQVMWLRDEVQSTIADLHAIGCPSSGPVRFTLVTRPEADPSNDIYSNAMLWPLSAPAATYAVSIPDTSHASPHYASGTEANSLRAIAVRRRNEEISRPWAGFAPIKDADGNLYELFVRDMLPFEDEHGHWEGNLAASPY